MTDDPNLHAVCFANEERTRAEFLAALNRERRRLGADREVAVRVRALLLPGLTRKTIRITELAAIVAAADSRAEQ